MKIFKPFFLRTLTNLRKKFLKEESDRIIKIAKLQYNKEI